jgi:hypothetical protein
VTVTVTAADARAALEALRFAGLHTTFGDIDTSLVAFAAVLEAALLEAAAGRAKASGASSVTGVKRGAAFRDSRTCVSGAGSCSPT